MGLGIPRRPGEVEPYWALIFGLPICTGCLQIMLLLFTFNYDTPKSLLLLNPGNPELVNLARSTE